MRLWNPTCTLPTGAASAAHRGSPPPPGSRILLSLMPAHKPGAHHSQADPGGGQLGEGGVLILVLHFLQLLPGGRGERREGARWLSGQSLCPTRPEFLAHEAPGPQAPARPPPIHGCTHLCVLAKPTPTLQDGPRCLPHRRKLRHRQ